VPEVDDMTEDANPKVTRTGRVDLPLYDGEGHDQENAIETVLRIDSVTLWLGNRTLAVIDRDRLCGWLTDSSSARPRTTLAMDDVVLSLAQGALSVNIDARVTYWVHPDDTHLWVQAVSDA
jgi:hypothetical protein